MNKEQEDWLKRHGVSASYGIVVKDKYGALHAIALEDLTVGMAEWCYEHGLTGPSPELGKAALDSLLHSLEGLVIDNGKITRG